MERPQEAMVRLARDAGRRLTNQHRYASSFLENRGLRFLVHYGYGNVIEVARAEWRKLRARKAR